MGAAAAEGSETLSEARAAGGLDGAAAGGLGGELRAATPLVPVEAPKPAPPKLPPPATKRALLGECRVPDVPGSLEVTGKDWTPGACRRMSLSVLAVVSYRCFKRRRPLLMDREKSSLGEGEGVRGGPSSQVWAHLISIELNRAYANLCKFITFRAVCGVENSSEKCALRNHIFQTYEESQGSCPKITVA